jgi:hypothetical protein
MRDGNLSAVRRVAHARAAVHHRPEIVHSAVQRVFAAVGSAGVHAHANAKPVPQLSAAGVALAARTALLQQRLNHTPHHKHHNYLNLFFFFFFAESKVEISRERCYLGPIGFAQRLLHCQTPEDGVQNREKCHHKSIA